MKKNTLLIGLAALTLIGCGGGGSGVNPVEYVAYDAPAISSAQKAEFLDAVNAARAVGRSCGKYGYMKAVPPLKWDDGLYRAAYEHSNDIAINGYSAHTGSGKQEDWTAQVLDLSRGSSAGERILNNGLDQSRSSYTYGENVSAGRNTTEEVVRDWLDSDGHCRNIMYLRFKMLGMAYVENDASQWKIYWTQTFGAE